MRTSEKSTTFEQSEFAEGFSEQEGKIPIDPLTGIAAIALNLALKYHDINTVQDGALYQQYKLEGRNMHGLHLDMVFETAMQIERHFAAAPKRLLGLAFDDIDKPAKELGEPSQGEMPDAIADGVNQS